MKESAAPSKPVVSGKRSLVIGLMIGAVVFGAAISMFCGQQAMRTIATLLGSMSVAVVCIHRLGNSLAKGPLLFDSEPPPKRKWLRALAIVALLVGIANLEFVRRTAELAPVSTRVQQDLASQSGVLSQTKLHLTEQLQIAQRMTQRKAAFNKLKHDQAALAKFNQLQRQDQAKFAAQSAMVQRDLAAQTKINAEAQQDRAEQARLNERLLPDEDAVQQGFVNLERGAADLLTDPWSVVKSQACFQLVLSMMCISSSLSLTLIVNGRIQIRENGLFQHGWLLRWARFDSYRWLDEKTVEFISGNIPLVKFPVAPDQKKAIDELLAQRLSVA